MVKRIGSKNAVLIASVVAPISNVMFSQAKTMDELLEWGMTGAVGTAIQSSFAFQYTGRGNRGRAQG